MLNKTLRYIVIAYLVYLALALVVVTPLLNFLPHKFVSDNYGRELATRFVWFNPFTVSLEAREAVLPEKDGEPFVSFDAMSVNLSLASLWSEGIVFDRIRLDALQAHVQRLAGGRFNFSDFIPQEPSETTAAPPVENAPEESGLLGVTVNDLDLKAAVIKVTDLDRQEVFSTQWENLEIHAVDFSTVLREGKPYRLSLSDEAGGALTWEGNVSVAEANSEGRLALDGLRLTPLGRFASPWVQFTVRDGQLDAALDYRASWGDEIAYSLTNGQLALRQLDILPKQGVELPDTQITLAALTVGGIAVESTTQTASVTKVALETLEVAGFSEGTNVSLQSLFTPQLPASAAPDESTSNTEQATWTAAVGRIEINGSTVRWRSQYTDPPTAELRRLNAHLENFQWPLAGTSPLSLQTTLNDSAGLSLEGTVNLARGEGQLNYSVDTMTLPWFNPALPSAFKAQLTGGQLSAQGDATLADFGPQSITLGATVDNFGMRQDDAEQQFTGWDKLELEGLSLDFAQRGVLLNKLTVDTLSGRVHIATDGTLNTANLWQPETDTPDAEDESDEPAAVASATEAEEAPAPTEAAEPTDTAAEPTGTAAESPWSVEIPTIQLRNAAIDFQDDSLPIEFRTLVGDLSGFIEGLSSDAEKSAKVDIKGSVDGYAPVALAGNLNPLKSPPALDLTLRFDGVDLARVTPYSGTYAGYAIDRGLLDLDLAYTLDDNRLAGKNVVVIDQLKLGDSVNSDKALDIPLKLGISLLTNANGVIDMKIPVSGNVDDPSFSLGSVIASAFVNLITKAVTAPFSLLANLVSSDEDLQHITFAPGDAQLSEASIGKLAQLAEALAQRPALSLAVVGRVHTAEDREALKRAELTSQLVTQGLSQASIDNRDEAWAAAITARTGQAVNAEGAPLTLQEGLQSVLDSITVDDSQLLVLAESRATKVKSFLVNDASLAPDRAVIEKASLETQERDFNGVELLIEN